MTRILILSLALVAVGSTPAAAVETGRLNVVFILIDDMGAHDLSCYGSKFHRTPHVDKLAREGFRFTDAYAACPVCSPTRAAILTGKYPARLNLTDFLPGRSIRPDQKLLRPTINQHLPLEEMTLAKALKAAGYATGHIGKWHLGGAGFEPERQGFDSNIGGSEAGSPYRYFAPYQNRQGRFMPGLEQAPAGEYLTDRLTAEAEKFIERNRTQPFFLYLAHYAVHIPLEARAELKAKYKATGKAGTQDNPIYAAMIESVDDCVGLIVRKLDELGLMERTLIIFTSDNGGLSVLEGPNTPSTINTPLREGKGYLYEGGIRVPLVVRGPGIAAGQTCTVRVSSIDFFPTILDLCGVKRTAVVDGVSLKPVLHGTGTIDREALFWHYPHYSNQGGRPGGAVRSGDYKLVEFYEQGRHELFNVKTDAGESRNLIEQQPAKAKQMTGLLDTWRTSVGAHMMKPNPAYVPNPQAADGSVTLPARTADVHGLQLRYEPLPHKNTLGYWTRTQDWASWEFEITKPGTFTVQLLQGCGQGQGGSEVEISVGGQVLKMVVEDTGHFQNFKPRVLGTVPLDKPGRDTLAVKPLSKKAGAVMDLREVSLKLSEP